MRKLLLASSFYEIAHNLEIFEKDLVGKTITFIPTASRVEEVVFYVDAAKKALEARGLTVEVLEVSTATTEEINDKLTENDYIYVSGGNTFYLLQELKRSGADQIIIREVCAGKLYIGESAGAIVTSPNIEYVKGMDDAYQAPQLLNYDALGLIDFYTVPHYNNAPFTEIAHQIVEQYDSILPISTISNHEAIIVKGDTIEIRANK